MTPGKAPEQFYYVGGAMYPDAPSYIERKADQELLEHTIAGDFCYMLTPRQMGKSSLMVRTANLLEKKNIRSAIIDLQEIKEKGISSDAFYAGILNNLIRQFRLPVKHSEWWQKHELLSSVQRFSNFISDELLPHVRNHLVIFIDEIDSTIHLDFSDAFFGAIRALYNGRARRSELKRLSFVLSGVASPSDLIKERTQTPFNIGFRIELEDFAFEEARKLARGFPLDAKSAERLLRYVLDWTGGNPYLTQKVCASLVSSEGITVDERAVETIIHELFFSDQTWSDPNLAETRNRMAENKDNPEVLLELYRRIISGEQIKDDERSPIHTLLKLSGIVKVFPGGLLKPRNRIYEQVFNNAWVDTVIHSLSGKKLPPRLDLEVWHTRLSDQLQDWRHRMRISGVDSIYGFLAAAALWPVAEAAQAGQWEALVELGRVIGSAGKNRLATYIKQWKDEADVARGITDCIVTEKALMAEIDAVLEALEVFSKGRESLPEEEQQWFASTLRAELAHQGHLARFDAQITGRGSITQEAGMVPGAGSIAIGGDVNQSVLITGSGNMVGNVYTGKPSRDPDEALSIYRRMIVSGCRHISLRGLDIGASDAMGKRQCFDLAQVYVALNTKAQAYPKKELLHTERDSFPEQKEKPLSALEAVIHNRRIVLLGDPGSGKSTFLTHFTLCLASHGLDSQSDWLAHLPGWPGKEADLVPVFITLRDFARWLHDKMPHKAEPCQIWRFIVSQLEAQNMTFVEDPLHERLEKGSAILLFDGLDEIPTSSKRSFIRDSINACARRYPDCRIIVTCRTLSYQDPAWKLLEFDNFELAPFTKKQIDDFIAGWYTELARMGTIKPGAVEGAIRHLKDAVGRPDLWRLASNPLLLTVMALVHTHKGRLPEARALLYEETVDILLWRWEQIKATGEEDVPTLRRLLAEADRAEVDLKRVLWQLAFEAHKEGGTKDTEGIADIGESQLYRRLIELHPDKSRDWAAQVIDLIKLRAGLLLERAPEVYTFPHRTFQEYLAGVYLSVQPDFVKQAAQLLAEGIFWREVVLLAVGRLVYKDGDTTKPLALVAELCPAQTSNNEGSWRQAWMAGDTLLDIGLNRVKETSLGRELNGRLRYRIADLIRKGALTPVERVAAGNTLARLGDPRFRPDAWYLPDEPLLGFVEIPAGPFLMGEGREQHQMNLPTFYISRYPVTVAQFKAFVDASGYKPKNPNYLQGQSNHPVVSVTWHDAIAYCQWLEKILREWEGTPEPLTQLLHFHSSSIDKSRTTLLDKLFWKGDRAKKNWHITLPNEAEWEKAARGTKGLTYPWGDKPDPNRANYGDTGIGTTSSVGCFPGGASPYGVEDMSGNVWEWTRSLWRKSYKKAFSYPYNPHDGRKDINASDEAPRVLRGGAFDVSEGCVLCAVRFRYFPSGGLRDLGFRVVASPYTSGL